MNTEERIRAAIAALNNSLTDGVTTIPFEPDPPAREKHYKPTELAALWHLSPTTIRKLFRHEPGVIKSGEVSGAGAKARATQGRRAVHVALTIPESIALRVHERIAGEGRGK